MITVLSLLKAQMDEGWNYLARAVEGVDDALLHWEPAPGSWGLRRKNGHWKLDYHIPDQITPGPKTIGWLIAHLATCKEIHTDLLFGSGRKSWSDLSIPGHTVGLRQYLERSHRILRGSLDQLKTEDLHHCIRKPSDSGHELTVWQALCFDIHHDFQHGGQIFQVRNEYHSSTHGHRAGPQP
jgi:hypothetical protein